MTEHYYTGIGSRQTPQSVRPEIAKIATWLGERGWILRSGAAPGADAWFEISSARTEIYLPWPHFMGHGSRLHTPSTEATRLAARHHPAWDRLSEAAKKLHARNSHQVLGADLKTPSAFVVCWTPGGRLEGGTAQALRIAAAYQIPIFNLANDDLFCTAEQRIRQLVEASSAP